MVLVALAAGCLVADPPPYAEPEKTPPVLALAEAVPPVYQVQLLSTTSEPQQVLIDVPVRSEDAGDKLVALLYVNWIAAGQDITPKVWEFDPSTFDKTDRSISIVWDYSLASAGCNQLTLIVTHKTNYDITRYSYIDSADIAIATWFFNIADDPPGTNALSDCPSSPGGIR